MLDGKACNQLNLAGVGPVQSPASKGNWIVNSKISTF